MLSGSWESGCGRRRVVLALCGAVAAFAALATSASAASVDVVPFADPSAGGESWKEVFYEAHPAETNRVTVKYGDGVDGYPVITISDAGVSSIINRTAPLFHCLTLGRLLGNPPQAVCHPIGLPIALDGIPIIELRATSIRLGPGDDHIHARNGHRDTIVCGDGVDSGLADGVDALVDCENVIPS